MTDREMICAICSWTWTNYKMHDCKNCPLRKHKADCLGVLLFDDTLTEHEHSIILDAYNKISAPLMTEDDMMSIF